MIVSIHQPNYFPYFPFFQKMQESDLMIILNHVQFEKGGFQNRFHVNDQWYTMSVNSGMDLICEKRYVSVQKDWKKIKSSLPVYPLYKFDDCVTQSLADMNYLIIDSARKMLKINTALQMDYRTPLTGTARLVDICKKHGATKYLSGISGKKYLDLKLFSDAGIEVIFQDESKMIKKPLIEMIK